MGGQLKSTRTVDVASARAVNLGDHPHSLAPTIIPNEPLLTQLYSLGDGRVVRAAIAKRRRHANVHADWSHLLRLRDRGTPHKQTRTLFLLSFFLFLSLLFLHTEEVLPPN